jgi:hypothetical protein
MIDEDLWDRMPRVARHCASTGPGRYSAPWVQLQDRCDAALDAITVYVAGNGWPGDDFRPLLQAAGRALQHLERDVPLHLRNRGYWLPRGRNGAIEDEVTDRVGVTQLLGGLTVTERAVVCALADAYLTGGGVAEAAESLGMTYSAYVQRLYAARQRARALWVAPGDTPFRRYVAKRGGRWTKAAQWRRNTTAWQRRAMRDEPA